MRYINKTRRNANVNGFKFEQKTRLKDLLEASGYSVIEHQIFDEEQNLFGLNVPQYSFYKIFLSKYSVDWKDRLSKRLIPDEALFNFSKKKLIILEKKFQSGGGSVDEKIQTCDFKLKQYKKLIAGLDMQIEFVYLLNDWFNNSKYRDALQYIEEVGCKYFFNSVPLSIFA